MKDLPSYKYYFQDIDEDIEDEDENDLDYLQTLSFNLTVMFKDFFIEHNVNNPEKINNFKKIIINSLKESTTSNNLEESTMINNNLKEQPTINNNL